MAKLTVKLKAYPVALPTMYGDFTIAVYESIKDKKEHAVLSFGPLSSGAPLVRIHSQCLTGDTFGSLRCDCGEQLHNSMQKIVKAGEGVILYLNQEGRGIGLSNKIRAYALQDQGLDTLEANVALHFPPDARDYKIAADMLQAMGLCTITLITNNPDKEKQMNSYGVKIKKTIPLEAKPNKVNKQYLITKKKKFGHRLSLI